MNPNWLVGFAAVKDPGNCPILDGENREEPARGALNGLWLSGDVVVLKGKVFPWAEAGCDML